MADYVTVEAQQDALRPLRMFVGALTGAAMGADQSYAYSDAWSYNRPYQYPIVSPGYGVGVEGLPISATAGGGLYVSPMLVMVGIGAAIALFWKR